MVSLAMLAVSSVAVENSTPFKNFGRWQAQGGLERILKNFERFFGKGAEVWTPLLHLHMMSTNPGAIFNVHERQAAAKTQAMLLIKRTQEVEPTASYALGVPLQI